MLYREFSPESFVMLVIPESQITKAFWEKITNNRQSE